MVAGVTTDLLPSHFLQTRYLAFSKIASFEQIPLLRRVHTASTYLSTLWVQHGLSQNRCNKHTWNLHFLDGIWIVDVDVDKSPPHYVGTTKLRKNPQNFILFSKEYSIQSKSLNRNSTVLEDFCWSAALSWSRPRLIFGTPVVSWNHQKHQIHISELPWHDTCHQNCQRLSSKNLFILYHAHKIAQLFLAVME